MTSIVDTPTAADSPDEGGADQLEAIHQRLLDEQPRFLGSAGEDGPEVYSPFALAQLVHEISTKFATDTVRALTGELAIASDEVRHLVDLLVASDEQVDRLSAENATLRELAQGPVA